jgi:hypothetical protein
MSCALTAGYSLACKDSVGGLKEVYLENFGDITYGAESSGVISTVTGSFYKYELPMNTAQFTETVTSSVENGTTFYQTELSIVLPKLTASLRNQLKLLAQAKLAVIAVDRNGEKWIMGLENGVYLTTGTSATGTAMGDLNGMTLTFTSMEKSPVVEFSGTIVVHT